MPASLAEMKAAKLAELKQLRQEADRRQRERLASTDVFATLGFTPNPGPQTRFLSLPDENLDVLFGGAVGGSKSISLLMYAIRACVRYPGLQAFWFRRTFPELEHSVLRMLARWGYGQPLGCKWRADKYELRFPGAGGSILTFAHAKNLQEATAYLSAEMNLLVIDERTTLPVDVVDMLYTRVRTGVPGVPVLGIRSATNPGDVGHSRVLSDYIEATGHGEHEIDPDGNGRRRIFIQSRIGDTPQLGADYLRNLQGLPEKLRKAYLEGDWTVFAGQVFDEWRYDRHVIRPFAIPESWHRVTGTDWGFAKPWCTLFIAVDEDSRAYVYRELYATQVGETEQATRVLGAVADDEHVSAHYADDSMWAGRGQEKSIADAWMEAGCALVPAGKGPGSRLARVQRMHSFLGEGPPCPAHRAMGWPSCPMIHVFQQCENLIRTLPTLPHPQSGHVEDVDTTAEDHAYDALTYALVNLGGGPQFPIFGDTVSETILQAEGIEALEPVGPFAVRPADPVGDILFAGQGFRRGDDGDGTSRTGTTQRAPWAT